MASSQLLWLLTLLIPGIPAGLLLILRLLARPRPAHVPMKGRHVLITGGSSGIGLALARAAAGKLGARVTILARSRARLDEARNSIRLATGADVTAVSADVTAVSADVRDEEAVKKAVAEAEKEKGPVDILVCNHGVFLPGEIEKMEMEEVRFQVDVNLIGTFHVIKAALPAMRAAASSSGVPAAIAIVSSQAGQVGVYGYTAYSASKFALRGLAEALQHEVVADNIRVSLVFPPDTETPGLTEEKNRRPEITSIIAGSSGGMKAEDVAKKALNGIKSGKFIVPCNFEGAMLAIATAGLSPQSSYVAAFLEVMGAGFMRFVGLFFQLSWFNIIENWHAKNK